MPLATAVGAVAALAASTHAAPAAVDRRVPIVGALTRLARAIGGAQAERGLAIVAVAAAVTVVAQLVAQARPGWAGRLAGVVAAGAMVSSPALRPLAAALSPATISLVALAVSVLTIDRVARGGGALMFEVITRRLDDRGGGLARVDGRLRLVEGLAMPREEVEFALSYYNTMTTWIDLDRLLEAFGLARNDLGNPETVTRAVRRFASRMPTYITLKDVKKRWGHGLSLIHI